VGDIFRKRCTVRLLQLRVVGVDCVNLTTLTGFVVGCLGVFVVDDLCGGEGTAVTLGWEFLDGDREILFAFHS